MKITIKEIAKEAGVSIATVSMIINNKDKTITEATRLRVLDVVNKYNYIPNAMAGSLVTQRTQLIGLILPDITNPFFPYIARGAEDKAKEAGYSIIFCNTDDNIESEEKYIKMLTNKTVDGIIIAHSSNSEKTPEMLKKCKVPIILIDRDFNSLNICGKVLVNNFEGAYDGVNYLINKGYKKIAYLSGPLKTMTASDRLKGYEKALRDNGINVDKKLIKNGYYKIDWGRAGINELLLENVKFDAIFCGNDLIAIGAIKELKNNGFIIPKDIAVMGFDDIYLAALTEPPLTTIRQPNYQMGYMAMELLLKNLENSKDLHNKCDLETVTLKASLIKRDST